MRDIRTVSASSSVRWWVALTQPALELVVEVVQPSLRPFQDLHLMEVWIWFGSYPFPFPPLLLMSGRGGPFDLPFPFPLLFFFCGWFARSSCLNLWILPLQSWKDDVSLPSMTQCTNTLDHR